MASFPDASHRAGLNVMEKCGSFSLPEGWVVHEKVRKGGSSAGRLDKYYIDPAGEYRFRSTKDVMQYLATGSVSRTVSRRRVRGKIASSTTGSSPSNERTCLFPNPTRSTATDYSNNRNIKVETQTATEFPVSATNPVPYPPAETPVKSPARRCFKRLATRRRKPNEEQLQPPSPIKSETSSDDANLSRDSSPSAFVTPNRRQL